MEDLSKSLVVVSVAIGRGTCWDLGIGEDLASSGGLGRIKGEVKLTVPEEKGVFLKIWEGI